MASENEGNDLTVEELDGESGEALPAREAMSVVDLAGGGEPIVLDPSPPYVDPETE